MAAQCPAGLDGKQRQLGLALAAEHREVDPDARDPTRLGERGRLRLELLGRQDASTARQGGIEPDPLQVARQLLDRVDGRRRA